MSSSSNSVSNNNNELNQQQPNNDVQIIESSNSKKTYTLGRPPWYDTTGKPRCPLVIGVCGGSASGKTSVCHRVIESLNTISDMRQGKRVHIPIYDFKTHSRLQRQETVYGADVIILEGILTLYSKELRDLMDIKIFIDTDDDVRLARRLRRDIAERGRTVDSVILQYTKFVKPSFDDYILPTKKHADVIIPRGSDNIVAIDLLTQHIRLKLKDRGYTPQKPINIVEGVTKDNLPKNIHILPPTNQVRALLSILRNKNTDVGNFVFYSDRLVNMIIEEALTHLPFKEKTVVTPVGTEYKGVEPDYNLCALSVLRAGSCMEQPLRSICKGIKTGKVLIQSDENKQPHLFYERLPDLTDSHVLVLDPTIASGASSQMAIRILLDHGVPENKIIFVTVVSSLKGALTLSYCFPELKIVTGALDDGLSEKGFILPGVGNYSDRYFGTSLK
ncbi:uridine kinase [Heterostelium album PN500]|uniref:uridine/cytidine kinase n=1 Tax=Heterostelium pallidum (strain ATCC 26659 / Pp 5 / PN500) TaxID=670386 RepID=D3BNE7_HETP5|nr:uridine kinase [Heterostelium album PN500]EFA76807.1 uridine kinase [Heterostelium album PN500]|eukprot:XP_020428939.1 uridine kinase [Heterostelium album PN500]